MFVPGLIERKRDGGVLASGEFRELMDAYAAGELPDYQMAALLMAIFLKGLTREETAALLDGMLASGSRLDLSSLGKPVIDKHSTGGVGDKVSLILAPLLAACGVAVPMMSGRGLGHTGGTLDKLESIPGFRTDLPLDQVKKQLEAIGCAMIGQTPEIAPVDKKIYALRDVTATVECVPLIAASIMSKKLAEGLTGLVLDVKQGSGAFISDPERSLQLAKTMIELGADRGCPKSSRASASSALSGPGLPAAFSWTRSAAYQRSSPCCLRPRGGPPPIWSACWWDRKEAGPAASARPVPRPKKASRSSWRARAMATAACFAVLFMEA